MNRWPRFPTYNHTIGLIEDCSVLRPSQNLNRRLVFFCGNVLTFLDYETTVRRTGKAEHWCPACTTHGLVLWQLGPRLL